jgi:Endonuclease/Exonuclease/phosphatase family 2
MSTLRRCFFYGTELTDIFSNVVWLADTNYRLDLDNERVRSLVESDNLDPLLAADQVIVTGIPFEMQILINSVTVKKVHGFASSLRRL